MSVHVARLFLRSQAFHWAELSWAERGACRGVCVYKADISCLVVRSSVNPRARYLMVGWTWTDIDGCVWTICIIHMFNMQNAAGTQATASCQGYLYACLCTHAHTYTHTYVKLYMCVCVIWNACKLCAASLKLATNFKCRLQINHNANRDCGSGAVKDRERERKRKRDGTKQIHFNLIKLVKQV